METNDQLRNDEILVPEILDKMIASLTGATTVTMQQRDYIVNAYHSLARDAAAWRMVQPPDVAAVETHIAEMLQCERDYTRSRSTADHDAVLRAQFNVVNTFRALAGERERYKEALEALAERGHHHDCNPTVDISDSFKEGLWLYDWLKKADDWVKDYAKGALSAAPAKEEG